MKILGGLAEGQVLQRLGSRGAAARLLIANAPAGPVRATLRDARGPLRGWNNRLVGDGGGTVILRDIPPGGPYRLGLRAGKSSADVSSFYVGDVWLLAGQSNMQGFGLMDGRPATHPLIRAFSLRREWRLAADPLHVLEESPDPCHTPRACTREEGERLRRTVERGVGPGLFFAREMLRRSGVPQGLICAAHGGTCMRQWNPALKARAGASLYGSMLLSVRVTGQPVAGLLWYQGEGDTHGRDPVFYTRRMIKLVAATRRDLGQPRLPWIIVQIARIFFDGNVAALWNNVQEQQRRLPDKIGRLELVASIDLPLDDLVHVGAAGFPRLAARMARAADRLVLGNTSEKRPPQLISLVPPRHPSRPGAPEHPILEVKFAPVVGSLRCEGEPQGFTVLDDGGRPVTAIFRTTLHGDTVRLHLISAETMTKLKRPSLSYGHDRAPRCNITDGRDFALSVFGPIPWRWR